jgi:hypothetical protein
MTIQKVEQVQRCCLAQAINFVNLAQYFLAVWNVTTEMLKVDTLETLVNRESKLKLKENR